MIERQEFSAVERVVNAMGVRTMVSEREGCEPALVCIHGNSLSRQIFTSLFSVSWLSHHRIVSYDLPGHGGSERPTVRSVYGIDGYAAHLSALISALGIRRFVLVGVSLGGHIAMQAADSCLSSMISGLFLCGAPPIRELGDIARAFVSIAGVPSLFQRDIDRVDAEKIARTLTRKRSDQLRCIESIVASDPVARERLVEGFTTEAIHDEYAFVTSTDLPIRLCYGEDERVVNLKYLEETGLSDWLQGSVRILPNEDHLPDMSEHSAFVVALCELVGSVNG